MVKYCAAYNCTYSDTKLNRKWNNFSQTPASDSQKPLEHKEHKVDLNSFSSKISPTEVYNAKYTLTTEHHSHITDSPKTLKRKLDELLEENDELRRRLRNRPPKEQ